MPLGQHRLMQIYPDNQTIGVHVKLSLHQYLKAYGIVVRGEDKISNYKDRISTVKKLMSSIGQGHVPRAIKNAIEEDYKKEDKGFYSGGWLEVWLANFIRSHLSLTDEDIRINMKLSRSNISELEYTEYDVVYIKDNNMYIGECKYFSRGKFTKEKLNKDWYKLAGLPLDMGLQVRSFLITANEIPEPLAEYFDESCPLFRIAGYCDIHTLKREARFIQFLEKL